MKKTKIKKGDFVSLQSLSGGMAGDKRFLHKFKIGKSRVKNIGLIPIVSLNALKGIEFIGKNPQKKSKRFNGCYIRTKNQNDYC